MDMLKVGRTKYFCTVMRKLIILFLLKNYYSFTFYGKIFNYF